MKQAKVLNEKQLRKVLKQIRLYNNHQRNRLTICLTYYGGLRIGEVASLKWADVLNTDFSIKDEIVLKAEQTKSKTTQRIFVSKKLNFEIKMFLFFYKKKFHSINLVAPLIRTQKNTSFSANSLCQLINLLYDRCNLQTATSHSGRRSFITALANKSINAKVIQQLARHQHLNTTQRYIEVNDEQMKIAVDLV